ncbi:hypothetical protein JTE90_002626 [Oedothorax gibbosus]|uniref:Ectonucleoside triphosphate diphosphohydrolase 1 n=1 Tax=Oedothorax gibbosus TaxID=931172 RepID=A0AAV6VFF3_9ARAC|nr:hypothetical protein JTE90_002626 [Oedothorax gibbosus]
MITLYVESTLASPLSGCRVIRLDPRASVRAVITSYLLAVESNGPTPGLAVYDSEMNKLDWSESLQDIGIETGNKLYIGHTRGTSYGPTHFAVVGISTLVISIILLSAAAILFCATGGGVPLDYGIVIDAGSTHTGVFLYQWPTIKDHGTGVVHQKDYCEYEEGIASLYDPIHIISCIRNVSLSIPMGSSVPRLYLGATGGMRLLNLTNPTDANLILMTLRYALKSSPVKVETINIIPGDDEAISSWISTNILLDALEQKENTFGALDLGGASTQYAFEVNNSTANFLNIEDITLYGQQYNIAAESFLCFGYFEALNRMESIMLMKNFTINGSSNYTECKKNVRHLLSDETCRNLGFSLCMPNINLGSLNSKFMAFSGFYYVVSYLNATDSLDKFIEASKEWCNMSLDKIKETQPEYQLEHVSNYCFASIYITELLTSKYGFNSTTWKNIIFTKEINKEEVGWSLGYMAKATNFLPEGSPTPPMISLSIFLPLLFVSIIMFFVGVLVVKMPIKHYFFSKGFEELQDI